MCHGQNRSHCPKVEADDKKWIVQEPGCPLTWNKQNQTWKCQDTGLQLPLLSFLALLLNAFGDFKAPNVDTRIKSFRRRSPIREDENLSRLFTTSGSHPGWLRPRKRHDDLCPLD